MCSSGCSTAQPSARPVTPYILATIHRAENTDDEDRLRGVVDALAALPHEVHLPTHPRLVARCQEFGIDLERGSIRPIEPLGYLDLVRTLSASSAVITDSGGLQKEAYVTGVPTSTLRTETEWVETLNGSWNVLVPDPALLGDVVSRPQPTADRGHPFGSGHAAELVIETLIANRRRCVQ